MSTTLDEPVVDPEHDKHVFGNSGELTAPCRWCKKLGRLKSFTYNGDGNKVIYQGLCSEACFESVKRIRQGKGVSILSPGAEYSLFSGVIYAIYVCYFC